MPPVRVLIADDHPLIRSGLRALLEPIIASSGLKVDYSGGPSEGSSDHTSFTSKQVPALFFFSGLHADYHKPSDTWDKIDAAGAVRLLSLVADVTEALCDTAARPAFVKVAQKWTQMTRDIERETRRGILVGDRFGVFRF